MANLYDRLAARPEGARALAAARLRQEALALLGQALDACGLSQTEIAKRLGNRKSATNQVLNGNGNVRINTLAEHLHVMGFELELRLVRAGEPRQAELENRPVRPFQAQPEVRVWQPEPIESTRLPGIDVSLRPGHSSQTADRSSTGIVFPDPRERLYPSAASSSTTIYEKRGS